MQVLIPREHLQELLDQDFTRLEIADHYGIAMPTLVKLARRHKVDLPDRKRFLTPDEETLLADMTARGETYVVMGRALNRSPGNVAAMVRSRKLQKFDRRKKNRPTREQVEKILPLRQTLREMAAHFGYRKHETMAAIIDEYGLIRLPPAPKPLPTRVELARLIAQGVSLQGIATIYRVGRGTISKLVAEWGLSPLDPRASLPTAEQLRAAQQAGMTYEQIRAEYGVSSRNTIINLFKKFDLATPRRGPAPGTRRQALRISG